MVIKKNKLIIPIIIVILIIVGSLVVGFIFQKPAFFKFLKLEQDQRPISTPTEDYSAQTGSCKKWNPGHYLLVSYSSSQKEVEEIISNPNNYIMGVQMGYYWKDLEPRKDVYNFSSIEEHLKIAKKYNKQLFVSFMDRNWDMNAQAVPDYLLSEAQYKGGVEPMIGSNNNRFIARLWDPLVMERSNKLIEALGKRFDNEPNFEGINFDESSLNIDTKNTTGYSGRAYANALISRADSAAKAFPNSTVLMYMNYGPPEIMDVINHLPEVGIGIGGPDLVPDEGRFDYQTRIPSYDYYPKLAGKVPLGIAVQSENFVKPEWYLSYCPSHQNEGVCEKDKEGNYEKRKGDFTIDGFWDMGINTLKLNYIFWLNTKGERYKFQFRQDILPYINMKEGKINEMCPESR